MDDRLKKRYIKRKDERETDHAHAIEKARGVAFLYGIDIKEDNNIRSGNYEYGTNYITINPDQLTAYTILHEIGHVFYGLSCCREHCEYVAHGIAIGLAHAYNITITQEDIELIDHYANCSAECPAEQAHRERYEKYIADKKTSQILISGTRL